MRITIRKQGTLFPLLITALLHVGMPAAVYGDVTIVTEVMTTGTPPAQERNASDATKPPQEPDTPNAPAVKTMTTYYRGKSARVEIGGTSVIIYDGVKNMVYTLDPAKKTYYAVALKKTLEPQGMMPADMPMKMRFETSVNLKKTDETKHIAGKETHKYLVTGTAKMKPDGFGGEGGFPGGGGMPPGGGGGFPGGGMPPSGGGGFPGGGPPGGGNMTLPSIEIEGEFWLGDTAILPPESKIASLPLLQTLLAGSPFLKPTNDKLGKMKRIPLSGKFVWRMTGGPQGEAQIPVSGMIEVKSVSEDNLDDVLFTVPSGYTKATPGTRRNRADNDAGADSGSVSVSDAL